MILELVKVRYRKVSYQYACKYNNHIVDLYRRKSQISG